MKTTLVIYLLDSLIKQNNEKQKIAKRDFAINDAHLSDHAKTLTDGLTSSEKQMFERRQYAAGVIGAINDANNSISTLIESLRVVK